MTQFADVPVLPDFPDGLADWVCTAFPNDDSQVDSFIVSLIALAVALPVTYVLQTCFEIANDNEAPESWLEWVGWRKLVFGPAAHRRWNYTLGQQPVRHVRWFVRSVAAPKTETALNLYHSLVAWLTGTPPPWTIEARDAEAEAAAARAKEDAEAEDKEHDGCEGFRCTTKQDAPHAYCVEDVRHGIDGNDCGEHAADGGADGVESESGESTLSSVHSARALARYKRFVMALGLSGTFFCWAIFTWCVRAAEGPGGVLPPDDDGGDPYACDKVAQALTRLHGGLRTCRFIFTYGMLLYKLLGEDGQASFARSWGISYAVGAASEWQDIVKEAIKGAIVLAILERLLMTRNSNWLEVRAATTDARCIAPDPICEGALHRRVTQPLMLLPHA